VEALFTQLAVPFCKTEHRPESPTGSWECASCYRRNLVATAIEQARHEAVEKFRCQFCKHEPGCSSSKDGDGGVICEGCFHEKIHDAEHRGPA
jgi:ribosomal protein L34E